MSDDKNANEAIGPTMLRIEAPSGAIYYLRLPADEKTMAFVKAIGAETRHCDTAHRTTCASDGASGDNRAETQEISV